MSTVIWVIVLIVVVGGIVIALFGWDRYRGKQQSTGASGDAQPTDEVFSDPTTGKRTRVWFNQKTGEREYRSE